MLLIIAQVGKYYLSIVFKALSGHYPNCSGKTALLKCLCRLLELIGVIYVDGENSSKTDPSALAKRILYLSSEADSSIDG